MACEAGELRLRHLTPRVTGKRKPSSGSGRSPLTPSALTVTFPFKAAETLRGAECRWEQRLRSDGHPAWTRNEEPGHPQSPIKII
ncbi:MAG: hypothetical protein ACTSUS_04335 [Candidatus Freyarchaeota archaeon]